MELQTARRAAHDDSEALRDAPKVVGMAGYAAVLGISQRTAERHVRERRAVVPPFRFDGCREWRWRLDDLIDAVNKAAEQARANGR